MNTNLERTSYLELSAPWISTEECSILPDSTNYEFADFLQLPSDTMETFMELGNIEEVKEEENTDLLTEENDILMDIMSEIGIAGSPDSSVSDMESTQSLIDEVESYLQTVEPLTVDVTDHLKVEDNLKVNTSEVKSEKSETDKIFDALTTGNVIQEDVSNLDFKNAFTTSVVGEDGKKVIIIIAPPASPPSTILPPASPNFNLSPSSVPSPLSPGAGSDGDWSPSAVAGSTITSPQRKKYQRKIKTSPPVTPYPKEKKERKKAQNRSAAWKYREKKKAEFDAVDSELESLMQRNNTLKRKMSDMEVELKCLKKLMVETGLGHYFNK